MTGSWEAGGAGVKIGYQAVWVSSRGHLASSVVQLVAYGAKVEARSITVSSRRQQVCAEGVSWSICQSCCTS